MSFDYGGVRHLEDNGDPGIARLVEAQHGRPWPRVSATSVPAREIVLNLLENFRTSELYRAYWMGRPMTSPIFNFYSVCTLGC